jgi:hypothetical protein
MARLAATLLLLIVAAVRSVLVNNTAARTTTNGSIVDSHNGGFIIPFNGSYHLYGVSYGDCTEQSQGCTNSTAGACGFGFNTTISVYSSQTLGQASWELVRADILPIPPGPLRGTVSRPSLVYCPRTNEWLLWWNFANATSGGQWALAVASSASPLGPFSLVAAPVVMPHDFIGDFTVFVDAVGANSTAWIYYTTWTPLALGQLFLVQLDPTFTRLAYPAVSFGPLFDGLGLMESPVMWKNGTQYIFLTGHGCCFCAEGSGVYVFSSESIKGPYISHGNIGCNYSQPATSVSVASHGCLLLGVCYTSILQVQLRAISSSLLIAS